MNLEASSSEMYPKSSVSEATQPKAADEVESVCSPCCGDFPGASHLQCTQVYGRNQWQKRFNQVMAGIKGLRSRFRTNDLNKQLQKKKAFGGIIFSVQLIKKKWCKINGNLISKDEHPSIKICKDTGMLCSPMFSETLIQLLLSLGPHSGGGWLSCTQCQPPLPSTSVHRRLLVLCLSVHGSEIQASLFSFASMQRRGTFGPLCILRFILYLQV